LVTFYKGKDMKDWKGEDYCQTKAKQ
jgi:hypothetical protein